MMKSRRVKSQSLGMPPWDIPAYFKKTQASKVGDAQGIDDYKLVNPKRKVMM